MLSSNNSKIKSNIFISIDVETTGTDISCDNIIEIAACKYSEGKLIETFTSLVNPNKKLSPFISKLTGIKDIDLINQPTFSQISNSFIEFIKDYPIVGHNIKFDIDFLNLELKKNNLYDSRCIYDTYHLAKIFLFYSESFKLSSLCENFNISTDNFHRAEDDALCTGNLFFEIIDIIKNTDLNILIKIKNLMEKFNFFNKDLIENIIINRLNENDNKSSDFYKNKIPSSFYFINKSNDNSINKDIESIFSKEGTLSKSIKNFESRRNQVDFAQDCLKNINEDSILFAEAETGIGKSFSYLVSSLLNDPDKKKVISTSTHNLQNQLFSKDIPLIAKALNIDIKSIIVKGMNNYLCKHRYDELINQPQQYLNDDEVLEFLSLSVWAEVTFTGDISECNSFRFKQNFKIWNLIKYESDICQLSKDFLHMGCFYQTMTQELKESNLLIVNHALLTSSINKNNNLINDCSICVIDEAHKLIENCREQLKQTLSINMINGVYEDFINLFSKIDMSDKPFINKKYLLISDYFSSFRNDFIKFIKEFGLDLVEQKKIVFNNYKLDLSFKYKEKNNFSNTLDPQIFLSILNKIKNVMTELKVPVFKHFNNSQKANYTVLDKRFKEITDSIQKTFFNDGQVNWMTIRSSGRDFIPESFNTTPFFINEFFVSITSKFDSMIFCSATLTVNDEFKFFVNEMGLDNLLLKKEMIFKRYPSNFFCNDQTKLFVLNTNNEVNSHQHFQNLFDLILMISKNVNKRMLVLCTSYSQIRMFEDMYNNSQNKDIKILFQSTTTSKQILLNNFINQKGSILIGTNTFWEGIDLPADKLEILLMPKLPFSSPSNPIVESKMNYYNSIGMNSFIEYQLPEAILRLKQGIGRLIRSQDDMGICILADPRILKKRYGKIILDSLNLEPIEFSDNNFVVSESKKFLGTL